MHLIKRLSWFGSGSSSLKSEHEHGKLVRKFGKKGCRKGQMDMPHGIAVSSEGDVVIADTENHRIQIFSPEGSLKRKFGEKGLDHDQLCYPMSLVITPGDKSILVTDSANSAVKVFDFRGKLLHIFEHSLFRMPYGISLTKDGYLVLTDIYHHRVVVLYLASGLLSHSFGSYGNADRQLDHPYNVVTNQNKQIIVSDYGNNAIKIFHFEGKLLRCFNSKDFRLPADDYIHLGGLAVDGDDNTLVVCNREVYILTKNGRLWEVLTENDGIVLPISFTVTNTGFIYLVNVDPAKFTEICVYRYNKDDYRSSKTDDDENDDDDDDGKEDVTSSQTEQRGDDDNDHDADDDDDDEDDKKEENEEEEKKGGDAGDDDNKEESMKEKETKRIKKSNRKETAEDPSFTIDLGLFYQDIGEKGIGKEDDIEKEKKYDDNNEDKDDKEEAEKLDVAGGGAFPLM